jgi:hypothetical protein
VESLKVACGRNFGTAGPAFVKMLLARFGGDPDVTCSTIVSEVDLLRDQLCNEAAAAGWQLRTQHRRAMRRFAWTALAGKWAADGILPHTETEVIAAVRAVRDAWLSEQVLLSEDEQAIESVRDYVQRFRGQMFVTGSGRGQAQHPNNCHGIVHDGRLLLTESNFREACGGLDIRLVANALDAAAILHRNDSQYKPKVSISELDIVKVRFYVLRLDRLFEGSVADEAAPSGGEAG